MSPQAAGKHQQLCESYKASGCPWEQGAFKLIWWVGCRASLAALSQPGAEQKWGISASQLWVLPNSQQLNPSQLAQLCAQGRISTSIPRCRAPSITHKPALAGRQIWALLTAPVAGSCDLTPEQELWFRKLQLEVESLDAWVHWGLRREAELPVPGLFPCLPGAFALLGIVSQTRRR